MARAVLGKSRLDSTKTHAWPTYVLTAHISDITDDDMKYPNIITQLTLTTRQWHFRMGGTLTLRPPLQTHPFLRLKNQVEWNYGHSRLSNLLAPSLYMPQCPHKVYIVTIIFVKRCAWQLWVLFKWNLVQILLRRASMVTRNIFYKCRHKVLKMISHNGNVCFKVIWYPGQLS